MSSWDDINPSFERMQRVRKLSTASQGLFPERNNNSNRFSGGKSDFIIKDEKVEGSQKMVEDSGFIQLVETKLIKRIACCHFMELIFFMFAFLWLIWLHEVLCISLLFNLPFYCYLETFIVSV